MAKLYVDTGFGFSEKQVISQKVVSDEAKLEFDLSSFSEIKALRFDPVNDYCVLHISSVVIVRKDDSSYELGYFQTNATYRKGNTLIFINNDPQILLDFSENTIQTVIINLEYIVVGEDSINYLMEYQDEIQMEKKQGVEWRDVTIREELLHVEGLHSVIKKYAKAVKDRMEELKRRDLHIDYLDNRIKTLIIQLDTESLSHNRFIDELYESISWKFATPLRWVLMHVSHIRNKIKTAFYFHFCQEYRLIVKSGLFDEQYYIKKNREIKKSNVNPLVHYIACGPKKGNDPNPLFNTSYYLDQNPGIGESGINPLAHYIEVGFNSGKYPNPLFDSSYYLQKNPEIAESNINPLLHYMDIGAKQRKDPHPLFDNSYYLDQNIDVAESGLNPLLHYLKYGAREGRDPHPLFDTSYYLDQNPDVAKSGMNPLLYYLKYGSSKGGNPNIFFDSLYYLSQNPDVAESGINPLIHYVNVGIREGRHPNSLIENISYAPKISIITRVFNVDKLYLHQCIHSVLNQTYDNWELCLVDEGNTKDDIKAIIEKYARKDCRVKVKLFKKEQGVAKALNEALCLATGEFIGLMEIGDRLNANALYEVVNTLNREKESDFIYSDEDKFNEDVGRYDPFFKPDWSPDMLRSYNYIRHLAIIRKGIAEAVGGFREGFEGSEDYDLFLRIGEKTENMAHIPKVLYHRRFVENVGKESAVEKSQQYENDKMALENHIHRVGLKGEVVSGRIDGTYHIRYNINGSPEVSIIIPTKDRVDVLRTCIDSILQRSSYSNYSILIVDNSSGERETFEYYSSLKDNPKISILEYDRPFNFSAVNNYAVSKTDSELLVFLNNDMEVISPDWIDEMLEIAQRKDVGAVGALLYYPNDTVQHGGVIIGLGGVAAHSHKHARGDSDGYFGRLKIIQNISAVTAACMMTKKSIFQNAEGFDENMSHAFNDVDYCLKLRDKGYLIVYTPYAEFYHHESVSRGYEIGEEQKKRFEKEVIYFQKKWKKILEQGDPYYNPNLTYDCEDFGVSVDYYESKRSK